MLHFLLPPAEADMLPPRKAPPAIIPSQTATQHAPPHSIPSEAIPTATATSPRSKRKAWSRILSKTILGLSDQQTRFQPRSPHHSLHPALRDLNLPPQFTLLPRLVQLRHAPLLRLCPPPLLARTEQRHRALHPHRTHVLCLHPAPRGPDMVTAV